MTIDSRVMLRELGYEYRYREEPPLKPDLAGKTFDEILPGVEDECPWLRGRRLYAHQLEALEALEAGRNLVLRSGTGSGKTEAWALYYARRAGEGGFRAIAVYPTLALANDQLRRLECYSRAAGAGAVKLDALSRDLIVKERGTAGLRNQVASSSLVVTNPAFLMHDVKRLVESPGRPLLAQFFRELDLLVLDELDFYGPRSLALLLGMVRILADYSEKETQVVALTATLANPGDMCAYLAQVTGRECSVVEGRPFRVRNNLILVLGKDLQSLWERARSFLGELEARGDVDGDVLEALRDYRVFVERAHRVIGYLQSLGYELPAPGMDAEEIVSRYLEDNGVTLVFTRSIARAEEVARRVRERVGEGAPIATHHHLVSKEARLRVEEGAKTGAVKVIVTPRTLVQGIDIGSVVRIVHLGLPEEVREFKQREGRKGRREEIEFTESIVLPLGRWDWELLSKGFEYFDKWLDLPLEKTIVNPRNHYLHLFTGLAKLKSPWYRGELGELEKEALRATGVLRGGEVDVERLSHVWERVNFYEYGPPYGIKRFLETGDRLLPLEPIGRCDLVEKFQIGCFDPMEDAVVLRHGLGRTTRTVTAVYEKRVREGALRESDAIMEAIEEYRDIKLRWGEEPRFMSDLARGRVSSDVNAVVYPPKRGFGRYLKVPNRVLWLLRSERPRLARLGGRSVVVYDSKVIYVSTPVHGQYDDYTYGFMYEAEEGESSVSLRLGLAFLKVLLRRLEAISTELLEYSVAMVGQKRFFEIHEPEAAGILTTLDWRRLRREAESYEPDDLDLILLGRVDEIAYSDLLSMGVEWGQVREFTLRVLDYILLRERIQAIVAGRRIDIPRPSPALKLLALDIVYHHYEQRGLPQLVAALATFDGQETHSAAQLVPFLPGVKPREELRLLEVAVEDLVIYEGYKLVVENLETAQKAARTVGLRRLERLLSEENTIALQPRLKKLGITPGSLPLLIEATSNRVPEEVDYPDAASLHRIVTAIEEGARSQRIFDRLRELLERRSKALYVMKLVTDRLLEEGGDQSSG